jgi:hypothetical protein
VQTWAKFITDIEMLWISLSQFFGKIDSLIFSILNRLHKMTSQQTAQILVYAQGRNGTENSATNMELLWGKEEILPSESSDGNLCGRQSLNDEIPPGVYV